MKKLRKPKLLIGLLFAGLLFLSSTASADVISTVTLPDPMTVLGPTTNGYQAPASILYGDFYSYSLPILQFILRQQTCSECKFNMTSLCNCSRIEDHLRQFSKGLLHLLR